MKVRVQFNWRNVSAPSFNERTLRDTGTMFRKRKHEVVLKNDKVDSWDLIEEIKDWLKENSITQNQYEMYGLFDKGQAETTFGGISFIFKCPTNSMLFKLRYE